jgi:eukaryotic-like serine/threonine-protein kinase
MSHQENASAAAKPIDDGTVDLPAAEVEKAMHQSLWDEGPLPGLRAPLVPEGYEILNRLGEGTYGEVWKARHVRTGVQVAVKFLRARTRAQLKSLGEEAKKLALLHADPRIVRLIDVEESTTPPYFVMDFAEHGSLAARLEKGPLPPAEALAIFRQVVEAMAYVHAKGIRHCDLKPANILLDAADRPRIADFGQSHLSVEPTATALGTFFYMAPEQAAAEKQIPDPRWDVFGLGALLYAMLTGAPPRFDKGFKAELETTAQLSHRLERYRKWVETSPAPKAHRAVAGMDRALAEIIDRCLAADPARRYRDGGRVLDALDRRERRRRNRPLVLFSILAPLLLVTGLGVAGLFVAGMANDERKAATLTLATHTRAADLMTAHLVADIVRDKLQDLRDTATVLAINDRLTQPFLRHVDMKSPATLAALEKALADVGEYESMAHLIAVYDTKADLRAAWMRSSDKARQHPREIYGHNYAFRDYWNHRGDAFGPHAPAAFVPYTEDGEEVPFIGQPYASQALEHFKAITVSTPLYRRDGGRSERQEFVGLLVICVKLNKFNEWLRSAEQVNGCVVVLDQRGHCIHHRSEIRERFDPLPGANPPQKSSPVYDYVRQGEEGNHEHTDPYDDRPYSAAYVPVRPFGWSVIFQYDTENEVASAQRRIDAQLQGSIGVAIALGLTLLAAFWGWLVWTLWRKEVGGHG